MLDALAAAVADDLKVRRAEAGAEKLQAFTAFAYTAGSWNRQRYVVTSLPGEARPLNEDVYCIRGQAENLIKMDKCQLASDRTSCQSRIANQVRLVLHTCAYWLMLSLRNAVPAANPLANAEFATLRRCLLKLSARVVERAVRIRIHLASACPDATLFRLLAGRFATAGAVIHGAVRPIEPTPLNPKRLQQPKPQIDAQRRQRHSRPSYTNPAPRPAQ